MAVVVWLFGRTDTDRHEAGREVSPWLWKEDYCAGEEAGGDGEAWAWRGGMLSLAWMTGRWHDQWRELWHCGLGLLVD